MGHAIGTTIEDVPAEQRLTTTTSRDIWGRVTTITSPKGAATIMVYDDLGRVKEVQEPAVVGDDDPRITRLAPNATRSISGQSGFNGRGIATIMTQKTPAVGVDVGYLTRQGGTLSGQAPYLHKTLTSIVERDDLDRPILVRQSVQNDQGTQAYVYDTRSDGTSAERVKAVKDFNGAWTIYGYDSAGRVRTVLTGATSATQTTITKSDQRRERYELDPAGSVTQVFVTYGAMASVEYPEEERFYDGFGRQVKSRETLSWRTTTTVHDAQGRVAGTQSLSGNDEPISRLKYTYHTASGDLASTTDLLRGTTTTVVASQKSLEQTVTDPLGRVMRQKTDGVGHVIEQFVGTGSIGIYAASIFDRDGNHLASSTGSTHAIALGHLGATSAVARLAGQPAAGCTAPWTIFNNAGHGVRTRRPELGAGAQQDILPTGNGQPAVSINEEGYAVFRDYDETGTLQRIREDGTDGWQRTTFINTSRPARTQVSLRWGRATRQGSPESKPEADDEAVVTIVDALGRTIEERRYSGLGQGQIPPQEEAGAMAARIAGLAASAEVKPVITRYHYGNFEQVEAVERIHHADLRRTAYSYYPVNAAPDDRRQIHRITVGVGTQSIEAPVQQTLQRTFAGYDRFGQATVLQEYHAEGPGTVVVVELTQQRGTAAPGESAYAFGQLISETTRVLTNGVPVSGALTVGYSYDAAGKRKEMQLPSGGVVVYDYEAEIWPQMATLFDGTQNREVWRIERDADFKLPIAEHRWGGTVTLYLDRAGLQHTGLVRSMRLGSPSGDVVVASSFDARGLRTTHSAWTSTPTTIMRRYHYDGLGRLDSALPESGGGDLFGVDVYGMDVVENRRTTRIAGQWLGYTPTAHGRYASAQVTTGTPTTLLASALPSGRTVPEPVAASGVVSFAYDERGNLTSDGLTTSTWDTLDRPVDETAIEDPYRSSRFRYDALGRRVMRIEKTPNPEGGAAIESEFRLVYDGRFLIEERVGSALALTARSHYNPDGHPVAYERWTPGATDSTAHILITDDQGTVAGVADASGAVVERLIYSATGLARVIGAPTQTGSALVPFAWQGMYRERVSGRLHTLRRDYDPLHGRWTSEDPMGMMDGWNRYHGYMGPNGTDPEGTFLSPLITAGFAVWDSVMYGTGHISGGEYGFRMAVNGASLAADVASGGFGGGLAVRTTAMAGRVAAMGGRLVNATSAGRTIATGLSRFSVSSAGQALGRGVAAANLGAGIGQAGVGLYAASSLYRDDNADLWTVADALRGAVGVASGYRMGGKISVSRASEGASLAYQRTLNDPAFRRIASTLGYSTEELATLGKRVRNWAASGKIRTEYNPLLGGFATPGGATVGRMRLLLGGSGLKSGTAHELTHMLQEIRYGALSAEVGGTLRRGIVRAYEYEAGVVGAMSVGKTPGLWESMTSRIASWNFPR